MSQTCTNLFTGTAVHRRHEELNRLADSTDPREVAATIVQLAQSEPGCRRAAVVFRLNGTGTPETEPVTKLDREEMDLVRAASKDASPAASISGRRLAMPLFRTNSATASSVLLLEVDRPADARRLADEMAAPIEIAGLHLRRTLEFANLQRSLQSLERSERLQRALFAISDLAGSDRDMHDMLRGVHAIVGELMYAENFYIVRYDAERDSLRFLYYVDVADPQPPGDDDEFPMRSIERSLTWYLLRESKPLMGNSEQLGIQVSGPLAIRGPRSKDWLGVPMLQGGRACGAIVVQSYQAGNYFSADDRTLLEFVGTHILTALERKRSKE
ncbi:MAG: GAF domain-containing protein, partial [Gammaproteobacteria bacterium]